MRDILDPALRDIARADELRPYDRYGKLDPMLEWLPLSGRRGSDYECFFIRFKPGAQSTPHLHSGGEEFYVISGSLVDCDGTRYKAGDYVVFAPGSKHYSRSPEGCLLLVVLRGENRKLEDVG